MSKPKLYCRKYGGDDQYSWAVFHRDSPVPIVTGCSITEARGHMAAVAKMYEKQ